MGSGIGGGALGSIGSSGMGGGAMSSGLNAFNIPKYGSGIGGGIGGGIGLSSYQPPGAGSGSGIGGDPYGFDNRNGSSASKRGGSRQGADALSGLGRHKF